MAGIVRIVSHSGMVAPEAANEWILGYAGREPQREQLADFYREGEKAREQFYRCKDKGGVFVGYPEWLGVMDSNGVALPAAVAVVLMGVDLHPEAMFDGTDPKDKERAEQVARMAEAFNHGHAEHA